jgi:3-methylcrotonyl-CoA carboxylase alpha subunit
VARTLILRDERGEHRASLESDGRVTIDDATLQTAAIAPGVVRAGDGARHVAWVAADGDLRWVFLDGEVFEIEVAREGTRRRGGSAHALLSAPMPATVVRVEVSEGAAVRRGDTLIILEAMKMELPIRASADGVVTGVHCRAGDLVQPGVPLVDID